MGPRGLNELTIGIIMLLIIIGVVLWTALV
jgi:hypothetical protein